MMKRTLAAAAACLCAVAWPAVAARADFEAAPRLTAGQLVSPALLSGPLYKVAEPVPIENYLGQFEIDSNVGVFRVAGSRMLAVRISELAAIQALDQVNKGDAFRQALAKSATAPIKFIGGAVTDPGKTVESVASGVGTILGRIGRVAAAGVDAVGDKASDLTRSQPQPASAPAATGEPEPPSFTGDPFGYNKARREWARKLNIDPYTTNPILRPKLDEAATASFAGSFAIETAIGVVAAPLQYAVEFDSTVRDAVWNLPVVDLEARNEARLNAMGIEGRLVRDFFRNRWFTPTLQTALVTVLEQLPNVRGRDAVVRAATVVRGEVRARSFINAVRALAKRDGSGEPITSIAMSGVVATGSTARGERVVAADLDYVWWNAQAAEFAARSDLAAKRRTLMLTGKVSDRARQELARSGWNVVSEVRAD